MNLLEYLYRLQVTVSWLVVLLMSSLAHHMFTCHQERWQVFLHHLKRFIKEFTILIILLFKKEHTSFISYHSLKEPYHMDLQQPLSSNRILREYQTRSYSLTLYWMPHQES